MSVLEKKCIFAPSLRRCVGRVAGAPFALSYLLVNVPMKLKEERKMQPARAISEHKRTMPCHGLGVAHYGPFPSKNTTCVFDVIISKQIGYSYYSDCTFTGKERDVETGYGYFGARYMDHELMTMWLSVDPLADKYPSISPYAYCAWNPLKFVDPGGDSLMMTKEAWETQLEAFKKVLGEGNVPFYYDEQTQKVGYNADFEGEYDEDQKEIINRYITMINDKSHRIDVSMVNNEEPFFVRGKGETTLNKEHATGITITDESQNSRVYISREPYCWMRKRDWRRHPQWNLLKLVSIFHETGGHAHNRAKGMKKGEDDIDTTNFENMCRHLFPVGSGDIRQPNASPYH